MFPSNTISILHPPPEKKSIVSLVYTYETIEQKGWLHFFLIFYIQTLFQRFSNPNSTMYVIAIAYSYMFHKFYNEIGYYIGNYQNYVVNFAGKDM